MRKLIAIASGDWHLHNFADFDYINQGISHRLSKSIEVINTIASTCRYYRVPLLFTGDLFHDPKSLDSDVLVYGSNAIREICSAIKYPEYPLSVYGIEGNHDQKQKNTLTHRSPNYLNMFKDIPNFFHLNNEAAILGREVLVYGIPYYTHESEWIKKIQEANKWVKGKKGKKILLLHGNAPNAKMPNGSTIQNQLPPHMDAFFKRWDLVLFGHIHRPQKLSEKCYMLGSPIQQNRGDEGCEMGYWEVYSDMTMKFISLNNKFPVFLSGKNIKHAKKGDYIIKAESTTTLESASQLIGDGFANISNRKTLSKAYCRAQGIKSKSKKNALTQILNEV